MGFQIPDVGEDSIGYPVLFWIHGGGYRRGSASQYEPGPLVEKGVVVVTTQYRLGSLGKSNYNKVRCSLVKFSL